MVESSKEMMNGDALLSKVLTISIQLQTETRLVIYTHTVRQHREATMMLLCMYHAAGSCTTYLFRPSLSQNQLLSAFLV